jgi:23S rRNA maturation mini-RNase III
MKQSNSRSVLLQQAWLGDAVLALYVRERILREQFSW